MKNKRIFLDTSAWILSFRKNTDVEIKERIKRYVASDRAFINQIVILELLQGCRNDREKIRLQQSLESLQVLPLLPNVWVRAYRLGFNLKRKGLTIPTVDILIASLAMENKCRLIHKDRHFCLISEQFTELEEEYLERPIGN